MFKQLLGMLSKWLTGRQPFDPFQLNDPVAMQTSWAAAHEGGPAFANHRSVLVNPDRLEFRMRFVDRFFNVIFILLGVGFVASLAFIVLTDIVPQNRFMLIPLVGSLVMATFGGYGMWLATFRIVFDKRSGLFWKGRRQPAGDFEETGLCETADLVNIHAVQLISKTCSGRKGPVLRYELNLVLEEGHRINVFDHSSRRRIRKDAAFITAFLEKPLWDAI